MQIGLQVWEKNKLLGVGMGDFRDATDKIYETEHPEIAVLDRRQPHNEFIWVLASTGIVGLVLFLLAFFYPILASWFFTLLFFHLFLPKLHWRNRWAQVFILYF
jgi:O-antigen ligase